MSVAQSLTVVELALDIVGAWLIAWNVFTTGPEKTVDQGVRARPEL